MRIISFGTYELAKHPRVGIVLEGLREHGDDVVEVNAPLDLTTADRVAMLHRPWLAYRLVLRIMSRWGTLARGARQARRGGPVGAVIVGYLGHFDVLLARLLFPRGRIVLDMMIFAADTARDRGVTGGLRLRLLDGIDRAAVRCADLVMVDTEEHVELLRPRARGKAVVVPVGAPGAWFAAGAAAAAAPPPDGAPVPALRVAFFGLYTPLQGAPAIGSALGALADRDDIEVTMIGAGQDLAATRAAAARNQNVRWLDWVESADMPALVAAHDVCLGIFGQTPKARRVVPNKVYQGAAAGCALVTSTTAPQRRALGDAAVFVPPGDGAQLAAVLSALAADRERVRNLQARARAVADARFAPSAIVEPLLPRLAALFSRWSR
jgi:glycosyltransferase involved in cell wall biosynthesis